MNGLGSEDQQYQNANFEEQLDIHGYAKRKNELEGTDEATAIEAEATEITTVTRLQVATNIDAHCVAAERAAENVNNDTYEVEHADADQEDDELEDDFAAFADACMDGTDSDSDERVYSGAVPRDLYEELCSDMADLELVGRPAAMRSYLRNRFRLIGDINFDDVCTELVDLVRRRRLGEMEDLLRKRFAPVGDQPVDEEREDIDGGRIGIPGIGPPCEATCPQQ